MSILEIKKLLNDSFHLDGDFLDCRVYNAQYFMHLIAAAKNQNKMAYGLDTWSGLDSPTKKDLCISNYYLHNKGALLTSKQSVNELLKREMPLFTEYNLIDSLAEISRKISFAIVDQIFYEPTKECLETLWDNMCYGGTIYLHNYKAETFAADLAITEFIQARGNSIIVNRQMLIDGRKQSFLIIKCFNEKNKPDNWNELSKDTKKTVVAMVLKTGGNYGPEYVNALANAVKRNTTKDIEIVCLTDNPMGFNSNVDRIVLFKHNYPKWWGKIELFRPDLFQDTHVFYIDLDTVIIDNIDEILNFQFDFCGLRDFYKMISLGSGLMSWNSSSVHKIYTEFVKNSDRVISTYTDGDQQWIDQYRPKTIFFQDIFAQEIISFKKDCLKRDGSVVIPKNAKIICFHGVPKPHEITNSLIKDHWHPDK